jgi:putative DNA primase/helicase
VPSVAAEEAAAGRPDVRRMMTAIRASQFGKPRTARCWSTATLDANRRKCSTPSESEVFGRTTGFQGKIIRPPSCQPAHHQRDGEVDRIATALNIWRAALPAADTLVETYLRSRGIKLTPPASLRFHPALQHPSGRLWPAMIALVTRGTDDKPVAIHRTFLARDGRDKTPVVPQKMMLGPCLGGAVRLGNANPDGWLMLAEGIETTLSVMQACGLPGWAALSSNGLRNLTLPPAAKMVLACADNDANGVGRRAAHDAAERFLREGRRVRVSTPPTPGMDFNDMQSAPTQFAEGVRHEH